MNSQSDLYKIAEGASPELRIATTPDGFNVVAVVPGGLPVFYGTLAFAIENLLDRLETYQGIVYALFLDNGLVKIGCTSTPLKRVKAWKTLLKAYGEVTVTEVMTTVPCTNYRALEADAHRQLSSQRVRGELFTCTQTDVAVTFSLLPFEDRREEKHRESEDTLRMFQGIVLGDIPNDN